MAPPDAALGPRVIAFRIRNIFLADSRRAALMLQTITRGLSRG